jgi:hypothetical protein
MKVYFISGLGADARLLPYRYVKADHTINKGGHIMIVNQAKQIDALLQNLLFE